MPQPEIGELFVGAYLRILKGCPVVQYNARDVAKGSQDEIDVLGLDYSKKELYVCEVVTHLGGALYSGSRSSDETIDRVTEKLSRRRRWVKTAFPDFPRPIFMLWSPYVPVGPKTAAFEALAAGWPAPGLLELRINAAYATAMTELIDAAAREEKQRGEDFFRMLQLLTHLRGPNNRRLPLRLDE